MNALNNSIPTLKGKRPRAIALMSGGLDSSLAALLVKSQGVEVIGLHLASPFGCRTDVEKNAKAIGVSLLVKEKGAAYLDLVKSPQYGYGKNMNPCIDCRIFMFQMAEKIMHEELADFIVTGEVLGQRPMSQRKVALNLIDRESPLEGRILRPLSAKILPPTVPENAGWIDREKLLNVAGRGRKVQLELAESFGIEDFDSPGGGCLLTESSFTQKLRDFFDHEGTETEELRLNQANLLRLGRHFRFPTKGKAIVGRNEMENRKLAEMWRSTGGVFLRTVGFSGPCAVHLGPWEEEEKALMGQLLARYSKLDADEIGRVEWENEKGQGVLWISEPLDETQLERYRL